VSIEDFIQQQVAEHEQAVIIAQHSYSPQLPSWWSFPRSPCPWTGLWELV